MTKMPKKPIATKPHKPELEPLSQYIKEILERHQLSQLGFSRRTGFPHRTLSTIILCQNTPDIGTIARLAEAIAMLPGEGDRLSVQDTLNNRIFYAPEDGKTIANDSNKLAMHIQYVGQVIQAEMRARNLDPSDPFDVQQFANTGRGIWENAQDLLILQGVIAGTLPPARWDERIFGMIITTLGRFTGDKERFSPRSFRQEVERQCDPPREPHDKKSPKKKPSRQV